MTCSEKYICPFCGAKGYRNVGDIIDQSFSPSDNSIWQLAVCDECGGSYQISFKLDPESVQIEPNQREKAWRQVVSTIKAYTEKYGEIVIDNGYDNFILDEEADFPENGIIHPALYD